VFITRDRRDRYVVRRAWPDGRFSDVRLPRHRDSPAGDGDIVAAPGRGVWFSWLLARRKSRLALSGKIKEFVPPRDYPERLGHTMDVGPDGNLWANTSQGVARFTPKGRYLPPIPVVIDDPWPRVDRIARGSDDAMYAGVDQPAYMARIDPADGSIVRHVMIPGGESGGSPFDDLRYWAMAPGPGALVWPISGFINYTAIDEIISDTIDPVGPNGRLSDRFLGLPDLSHPNLETVSPEHFGLVAGLDGRMWFTERLTRKLQAWRSPWSTASPRGRGRIIRTRKVGRGRWLRVELGCTGTTGGYCVGSLQLRAGGRPAGRRVRYAVAAGPPAVQSRSARWLRIPRRIAPGRLAVSHRRSGR
jgi:hypothetical protein